MNKRVIYTDANSVNMQKRVPSGVIQADYYPISTAVAMQDSTTRLTILSRQALGAASLQDGHVEIMLDRILNQDDGRGLGEPVTDSVPNAITFWFALEDITRDALQPHTVLSAWVRFHCSLLNNPPTLMTNSKPVTTADNSIALQPNYLTHFTPSLGASRDVDMISLFTTTPDRDDTLIIRMFNPSPYTYSTATIGQLFLGQQIVDAQELSLSLLDHVKKRKTLHFNANVNEKLTRVKGSPFVGVPQLAPEVPTSDGQLTLNPMQMKTVFLVLKPQSHIEHTNGSTSNLLTRPAHTIPSPPHPTFPSFANPRVTQPELPIANYYYLSTLSIILMLVACFFFTSRRRRRTRVNPKSAV